MANPIRKTSVLGFAAILALTVVLTLAVVACSGGQATANPGNGSGSSSQEALSSDFASLKGDISIDGSSTVFPVSEAVAEEFGILTDGNVRITVGVSGSGGGFKKFCNGETHIANASRPIQASEVGLCADAGIDFIETPVAIDGVSVMVNPSNDFVECITIDELHTMWGPDAEETITKWNQVRSDWPDSKFRLYGPGVDSGTFDYFTEVVNDEAQSSRGDFIASEDDNVLVQGISGDKNGLGFFGYAYYIENAEKLKLVAIDGGNGCVSPSEETIGNGSYAPLARPLLFYVRADALADPHMAKFAEFHLSVEGGQELVVEAGYLPYPASVYELAQERLDRKLTGTLFGGENPQKGDVETILSNNR